MKQYPILGMFVTLCGLLKKLIYSCMRNDISPILRPLDRWVGRLLVPRHAATGDMSTKDCVFSNTPTR